MNRKTFLAHFGLNMTESQLKAWFIKRNYLYEKGDKLSVSNQGHRYLKLKPVTFGDFIDIDENTGGELAKFIQQTLTNSKAKK